MIDVAGSGSDNGDSGSTGGSGDDSTGDNGSSGGPGGKGFFDASVSDAGFAGAAAFAHRAYSVAAASSGLSPFIFSPPCCFVYHPLKPDLRAIQYSKKRDSEKITYKTIAWEGEAL